MRSHLSGSRHLRAARESFRRDRPCRAYGACVPRLRQRLYFSRMRTHISGVACGERTGGAATHESLRCVPRLWQRLSLRTRSFRHPAVSLDTSSCTSPFFAVHVLHFNSHPRRGWRIYAGRVRVRTQRTVTAARVTPVRSPWRADATCVPRSRQRQSFSRTLWSQ